MRDNTPKAKYEEGNIDAVGHLKIKLEKRIPLRDFFNVHSLSLPADFHRLKERVLQNLEDMPGNYMSIFAIFLVLYIIIKPISIVPVCLWAILSLYLSSDNAQSVTISGHSVLKRYLYIAMSVFTVVFVLLRPDTIVSFFFVIGLAVALISAHLSLFVHADTNDAV